MTRLARTFLWLLVAGLVLVALLPLVPTDRWFVRMADFPRLQFLILSIPVALAAALLGRNGGWLRWGAVAVALAGLSHGVTLWPWITGSREAASCPAGSDRLSVLVANVRMTNDPDRRLVDIVTAADPDLFLALETNDDWSRALEPLQTRLPHVIAEPDGDYYGIMLMSRLPLVDAQVIYPADVTTPSIHAQIPLPSGRTVVFQGLHPRPPHPGQSARSRDAQILATATALAAAPSYVLAGDLNATPWETTIRAAADVAGWRDPRRAFGYTATYSARSWWRRWPLDYVLPSPDWTVGRFDRLPAFGSDHLPILAELCREG
ncbi:endonuclease/exonuclease/phosphatase family protein [uncultured Paracoccus sp.]|uniref:endonuclease/exonuclease/phosphatase family protein n=1 Tax=uncultured Paracoccus sp. TaxID=189685 RepID=UPI00263A3CC3|nr:endonuclease/exonuclease/phosphatase family protein [uncultured Paracoccus sp.]